MKWYDWLAIALLIVGGLNWAAVGLLDFDFVAFIFRGFRRWVYGLVGVAAIYSIWSLIKLARK